MAEVVGSSPTSSTILGVLMPSLPRRALGKTLSYKSIMLVLHFGIGYAFTGSWQFGSALAIIDLVVGLFVFYYHERMWNTKIRWGKVKRKDMRP
jgi:uncharacterized membrane protein